MPGLRARRSRDGGPPGPRGSFLTGNLATYEGDRLGFLLQLRREFGPVVRLGARTTVIFDPDLALRVLRDRTATFGVRQNFLQQRVDGTEMADRLAPRPLLNAALRPSAIQHLGAVFSTRLVAELDAAGATMQAWLDPLQVLERAISRAMAELWFGPGSDDLAERIGRLLDELGRIIGNPFAAPDWAPSPTRRRIEERYDEVLDVVIPALEVRSLSPGRYADFADAVMTSNGGTHSVARVADMLIGALLAAHRVPAAAGAWLLMLLADHPAAQDETRDEAQAPTGHGLSAEGPLRNVVLETLRLYPATWMLARTADEPVQLGAWLFPKGHNFLISPFVIHRDERLFPDATRFLPERWRAQRPDQTAFLTFGSGIHLCPGRSLTRAILSAIVTTIVCRYTIERLPGPVTADPRTTLVPVGLQVRLTPRSAVVGQAPADFCDAVSL